MFFGACFPILTLLSLLNNILVCSEPDSPLLPLIPSYTIRCIAAARHGTTPSDAPHTSAVLYHDPPGLKLGA